MSEGLVTYPRDALLTTKEVASALRVSTRKVRAMGLPEIDLGFKTHRYPWGAVLDYLAKRAK